MAVKSKKTPEQGFDKQRADIKELQQRIAAGGLLDIQSKDELLIDDYIESYGNGDKQFLRSEVERLGQGVVARAALLLDRLPEARENAHRALQIIDRVDQETPWLRSMDARDLTLALQGSGGLDLPPPSLLLGQIIDALRRVHDCRQVLLEHRLELRLPPGGLILADLFVTNMCHFHERQTGRDAPKGKTGPFVRFMDAAWFDLKFPALIESTLGNMVERLPHSKRKIHGRTR
jgi:hypothetical protein